MSKYFRPCRLCDSCHDFSALLLYLKSARDKCEEKTMTVFQIQFYLWTQIKFHTIFMCHQVLYNHANISKSRLSQLDGQIASQPDLMTAILSQPFIQTHRCRCRYRCIHLSTYMHVQSCLTLSTPWTAACQSFTVSRSLLKLMCIESAIPSTISSSVVPFSCF